MDIIDNDTVRAPNVFDLYPEGRGVRDLADSVYLEIEAEMVRQLVERVFSRTAGTVGDLLSILEISILDLNDVRNRSEWAAQGPLCGANLFDLLGLSDDDGVEPQLRHISVRDLMMHLAHFDPIEGMDYNEERSWSLILRASEIHGPEVLRRRVLDVAEGIVGKGSGSAGDGAS